MTRIVERCPNCGVEHDVEEAGECEACGSPLRFWCRTHSREIGWLEAGECPRCPPGTARVKPRPAPPPPPPPRPVVSDAPAATRATATATAAAPPPAPAIPVTPVAPPPAVPVATAPAAEEQPREEPARRKAPRQGPVLRLFNAMLTTLQGGIVGVLVGVGTGGFRAFMAAADIPATAVEWGVYGGMLGLVLGGLAALPGLLGSSSPPGR